MSERHAPEPGGAPPTDFISALRQIEALRLEKRELHREIIEMRSLLAEAERQLGNIRQTFTYKIGDAIVSARKWKGLRTLPRRLLALRRAFVEKRRVQAPEGPGARPAVALRYADEALKILKARGLAPAAAWVRARPAAESSRKARALADLALAVHDRDPAAAGALGVEAARLDPAEPRLRDLALDLFERGAVADPAAILEAMSARNGADPALVRRMGSMAAHLSQLGAPLAFPLRGPAARAGSPRLAVVAVESLPGGGGPIAFRARAVLEAARAGGLPAVLVTASGADDVARLDAVAGDRVIPFPAARVDPDHLGAFAEEAGEALAAVFAAEGVTHVHVLADGGLDAAAAWAARVSGAGLTLDVGELPAFGRDGDAGWLGTERGRARMSLFTTTLAAADQVIARSAPAALALAGLGPTLEPRLVDDPLPAAFHAAPPERVAAYRESAGLAGRKVVGLIGAAPANEGFAGEGLADLIAALPAILAREPAAMVLIRGEAGWNHAAMRLAARLGVAEALRVAEPTTGERLADHLAACDVLVFAGADAFELRAALSLGAPLIALDGEAARHWLARDAGLVVAPGDRERLAAAVISLIGDPNQPRAPCPARTDADAVHHQLIELWGVGRPAEPRRRTASS